jgi:N-acetylglucosamine kinase-like BadF-type ATPase
VSRSQKPRKKYDAAKEWRRQEQLARQFDGRINAQAEELIKASLARTLSDGDLAKLAVQYHAAFATLRLCGGHEAFKDVAAAILIAQRFAEVGIAPEFAGEINEALKALHRVQERALGTGRWLLDGDGLKSVMRGMAIYDAQMDVATYGQLREAVVEAARRNDEVLGAEARELMKEAA